MRDMLIEALRPVMATSPETRSLGCDAITDLVAEFTKSEARTVCHVLTRLLLIEDDQGCQEAELNALVQLASRGFIFHEFVEQLTTLNRTALHGSSVEHYDYLLSSADEGRPV